MMRAPVAAQAFKLTLTSTIVHHPWSISLQNIVFS